jgi:glc operon protein GlcG
MVSSAAFARVARFVRFAHAFTGRIHFTRAPPVVRGASSAAVTALAITALAITTLSIATISIAASPCLLAQTPAVPTAPLPYGPGLTLPQARAVAIAAAAEAARNNWRAVIAIVDSSGQLVTLDRLDGAQFGSVEIARQKAWSAVAFKRPTKAFEETLAGGVTGLRMLKMEGVMPVEGGLLLVLDGRIVGGIGVSGVQPAQDGQIAKAGAHALAAAAAGR